jgi:hypothetical protein
VMMAAMHSASGRARSCSATAATTPAARAWIRQPSKPAAGDADGAGMPVASRPIFHRLCGRRMGRGLFDGDDRGVRACRRGARPDAGDIGERIGRTGLMGRRTRRGCCAGRMSSGCGWTGRRRLG